jgi:hypothetical protein
MSKQTAVEWLVQKLINRQNGIVDEFPVLSLDEIYDQAKEMEKEQIENAYWDGGQDVPANVCRCEEYYSENYGGKP